MTVATVATVACKTRFSFQTKCCHGKFCDSTSLSSVGDCYWSFATYGVDLLCNSDDEAVFGICGAGDNGDCGGDYFGIQCCTVNRI